jgi:hypothetical protein
MKDYLTYDIKYDLGNEWNGMVKPYLPDQVLIEGVPDDVASDFNQLEEHLANEISETTGFCVENFDYQIFPFPSKNENTKK